jgi:hypothetical protein
LSRIPVKPYLITKREDGTFQLTVRVTRYNSQNYPLVTATVRDEVFKTATALRTFAREEFGAEPGQYATK